MQFLLQKLVRRVRRTGQRIIVVMDQGSPYHAASLARYLEDVKAHLEVFWLPHYSPQLNPIEWLWKHLKALGLANVLWPSFNAFTRYIGTVLTQFALHPDFVLSVIRINSSDSNTEEHTRCYLDARRHLHHADN